MALNHAANQLAGSAILIDQLRTRAGVHIPTGVVTKASVAACDVRRMPWLDNHLRWLLHQLGIGSAGCIDIADGCIGAHALFILRDRSDA